MGFFNLPGRKKPAKQTLKLHNLKTEAPVKLNKELIISCFSWLGIFKISLAKYNF
jgi:hypothetical protein